MKERESAYWDTVAEQIMDGGVLHDNWRKRELINGFLSRESWREQNVLEIGVGAGVSAGVLSIAAGGGMKYVGTEMSDKFVNVAKQYFRLNVVKADILSLPEGPFTRIIALDSLEHVLPEDRPKGFKAIVDRLSDGGLLLINTPCHRSSHKDEFDHGFDLRDLAMFEELGLRLRKYEMYQYRLNKGMRFAAFLTMFK